MAWFGLSHDKAWGDVGHSFADLASREDQQKDGGRAPQLQVSAAGTRSSAIPKGAGSFQLQTEWQLASRPGKNSYNTEASECYKQPPQSARPAISQAARGKGTSFPKESYPTEFRTSKQLDFAAERLAHVQAPVRAIRPKVCETASLIRPAQSTQEPAAQAPKVHSQQENVPVSTDVMGKTRRVADIRMPAFNIITGSETAGADKLKFWNGQQMDYRRRR